MNVRGLVMEEIELLLPDTKLRKDIPKQVIFRDLTKSMSGFADIYCEIIHDVYELRIRKLNQGVNVAPISRF